MPKYLLLIYLAASSSWWFALYAAADEQSTTGEIIGTKITEFPRWFKESFLEIADDVQEAAEQGRHLILFFHLNDCPYCHKMIEENFKHAPYTQFLKENFDVIVINIRGAREVAFTPELSLKENELARHLGVRYTPTILFLDRDNQAVLRLNGYRSQQAFKDALDFVQDRAYRSTSLSRYIEDKARKPVYAFRDHPRFSDISDLHQAASKPLAVIFEDSSCDECGAFHDEILGLPETEKLLEKFTVVRLDAHSDRQITDVSGAVSTPRTFAADLDIAYRPGVVLFDKGREITRVDGMLRGFHFQHVLRYVADRQYEQYPLFGDYLRASSREILKSGQDIDLWK
jgi:thioredoxin-related protein